MHDRRAAVAPALTLLGALACASPLEAAPLIPEEYQGGWCLSDDDATGRELPQGNLPATYHWGSCDKNSDDTLQVTSGGFTTGEVRCRSVEVTKINVYPWGKRAHVNPWGPILHIKFRCERAGQMWTTGAQSWQREKDYIMIKEASRPHR